MLIVATEPMSWDPGPDDAFSRIVRWVSPTIGADFWDDVPPEVADYIVAPFSLAYRDASPRRPGEAMRQFVNRLPYWDRYPEKHVLIENSDTDHPHPWLAAGALLKTSANYRYPQIHPLHFNVTGMPPMPDIAEASIDIGFMGCWKTHPIRKSLDIWTRTWKGLKVDFEFTDTPFFSLPQPERASRQARYLAQMAATKFVLCPRGRGLNSRRFFEALACGRIPVLYSDAASLPLEHLIDYDRFVVRVPEGMGRWTPDYLADFIARQSLESASRLALHFFHKYFAPARFRSFLELALKVS
jgi:hypothetical protein